MQPAPVGTEDDRGGEFRAAAVLGAFLRGGLGIALSRLEPCRRKDKATPGERQPPWATREERQHIVQQAVYQNRGPRIYS